MLTSLENSAQNPPLTTARSSNGEFTREWERKASEKNRRNSICLTQRCTIIGKSKSRREAFASHGGIFFSCIAKRAFTNLVRKQRVSPCVGVRLPTSTKKKKVHFIRPLNICISSRYDTGNIITATQLHRLSNRKNCCHGNYRNMMTTYEEKKISTSHEISLASARRRE